MAALLRQGARRIVGSLLQRTKAAVTSPAVAEERRRLVTRRMYSTDELQQARKGIAREIQQRKDELFDLIARGEENARTSTWHNTWLLQYLSEEVTPRPSDSLLEGVKESNRGFRGLRRAGLFSLIFVTWDYHNRHAADKKVDLVTKMEKKHGASEVESRILPDGNEELVGKPEDKILALL